MELSTCDNNRLEDIKSKLKKGSPLDHDIEWAKLHMEMYFDNKKPSKETAEGVVKKYVKNKSPRT